MLDLKAGATKLSAPVEVDLSEIMRTSPLITDFPPLPSQDLIIAAINDQQASSSKETPVPRHKKSTASSSSKSSSGPPVYQGGRGRNGSSVRPFHRRFRPLRSRPTRRPSARRQTESLRRGSGPGGTARSVSGQMSVKRVLRIRARQNGSTLGLRGKGGCGRGHSFAVAIWEGEEKMLKVRRIWPRVVYIQICKSALYSIRVNRSAYDECSPSQTL